MPHEPNRALARHKLESLAWEKTPRDYRGSSGIRREVLLNTTEGTTLVPLGEMTDYQLRRYIGPGALEEAGDMKKNGEGVYAGTAAEEDDYVIWRHGTSDLYYVDRVGRNGAAVKATGKPASSLKGAVAELRKEALRRGYTSGLIFEMRSGEDDLRQIGQVKRGTGMDFESNPSRELPKDPAPHYVDRGDPVFIIGDYVERKDGLGNGKVTDISTKRGAIEYLVKLNNGDRLWFDESELVVPGHWKNHSRADADETAARELSLYIENEYSLVGAPNSQGKAIEKNLLGHLRRGNFDLKKAELAYMYLMETGAKKYCKEFAEERDWPKVFNKPTRELVAHEFATTFAEEHGASKSLARNSQIEIAEFDAPAHWASSFINGDSSGLSDEEAAEFDAWVAQHPKLGWVVSASEETHIGRWNGLQTELLTYTAHVQ